MEVENGMRWLHMLTNYNCLPNVRVWVCVCLCVCSDFRHLCGCCSCWFVVEAEKWHILPWFKYLRITNSVVFARHFLWNSFFSLFVCSFSYSRYSSFIFVSFFLPLLFLWIECVLLFLYGCCFWNVCQKMLFFFSFMLQNPDIYYKRTY